MRRSATALGRTSSLTRGVQGRPSLALLVFDSVSLNHFKRNMPRTAKFLVDHDFFTFNMHNEAGFFGGLNRCAKYVSKHGN